MKSIPIFPLNLVVFPGSKYPLHIFEERYKILINRCLEDNSGFGIVALIDKKISDIGVFVKVNQVLTKYENGEMDIIVEGIERFLINSTKLHANGYYVSEVEKYSDNKIEIDLSLIEELQNDFEEIVELANYKLEDSFWKNLKTAKLKSYKIAEKSGMSNDQQQEFLILKSENERLYFLINYFNLIKEKVNNADLIKKIIVNDGYIN
jgi:ATP-dependent Lon protease